jgi:hypothetical protein
MAFSYKKGKPEWERHYWSEIEEIEKDYPAGDLRDLLARYWREMNSDIYQNIDGTPIRPNVKQKEG